MREIVELREKHAKLIHDAREIVEQAGKRPEGERKLTEEEDRRYAALFGEARDLVPEIKREKDLLEEERRIAANADRADPPKDDPDDPEQRGKPKKDAEYRTVRGTPEYRAAFDKWLGRGIHSLSGDERRAIQLDDDVSAGFLVASEQFVNQMIKFVDDFVFIRALATKHTLVNAKSLGAPSLDTDVDDHDWTGEITAATEDTGIAIGKREFNPSNLSKEIKISRDLLRNSSAGAESLVSQRLGYKVALTQEKAFLTGSGALQPLGVFTAHADGISTSRDHSTGNTTTAIVSDNLKGQKYNIKAPYRSRAQWLFHRDAIEMVSKLKDGDGRYLWQTEGLRAGDPDRLLGMPVMESEHVPAVFTSGLYVGLLGDFSHYWIVDSLDQELQRLDELYAATNQVGFISRSKTDGMPVLEEAFTRVKLG